MNSNEEIYRLKSIIAELEEENRQLRVLLDQNGISYVDKAVDKADPVSAAPIVPTITEEKAVQFFSMFWGRTDVYSKRYVNKRNGAAGYFPQCENFWTNGCPRKYGQKIKCRECGYRKWRKLGKKQIMQHLQGGAEDGSDVIGIYPLFPDGTCRFLVFDFDNHKKDAEKNDLANVDDQWKSEVDALRRICEINGIDALIERSRSGRGAHVWIFFEKPIKAATARRFGDMLLNKGAESVNLTSFTYYDRMLPAQEHLPEGGLGNLIALPLQGRALQEKNSAFVDANWNAYPEQWNILLSKTKYSEAFIKECIDKWQGKSADTDQKSFQLITESAVRAEQTQITETEKPWDRSLDFHQEDVGGIIQIILADAVYIDKTNLQPRIQNQIRRLAAFSNPVFYKNKAIGLFNFDNPRFIYMGSDENGYIRLPRGLKEELLTRCEECEIPVEMKDLRNLGRTIDVSFMGDLRESQQKAVDKLLSFETGILSAATAFGKTVVCTNMIAQRRVSTLILLQSSALVEQWEKALDTFLVVNEEPPQYETPSGQIRRRKSAIGRIQGAHDSSTGIIDIAMAGSLCKKGEFHSRLREYGMVILDECHHGASATLINILQEVHAKYVYGVTATPSRGDGLEKINNMLLGPIRYQYTAKERAREQGIDHLVYPRFTRAVTPYMQKERMHPNEAYAIVRDNPARDDLIVKDVRRCVEWGRTPVILSKFKDHSERLYERLQNCAQHVFLLSGVNSKKEHRSILAQMSNIPDNESMILVATGQLIGEGFDYPRLDTLMMATPVSGKSVVEQYAGRLNRDYAGKKDVIIYDYVDIHIPVLDRMYGKRLKAYKKIGYEICAGINQSYDNAQPDNAIYDYESYGEIFTKDLRQAQKEIIISSPAISSKKVEAMISDLMEKQICGVNIIIVTWEPDIYGYGDGGHWAELHERMRKAGFLVNLVSDHCEHFTIIDREIVWYGSMNFLSKADLEDNLMRVISKEIAAELMEMTFEHDKAQEKQNHADTQ